MASYGQKFGGWESLSLWSARPICGSTKHISRETGCILRLQAKRGAPWKMQSGTGRSLVQRTRQKVIDQRISEKRLSPIKDCEGPTSASAERFTRRCELCRLA